MAEKQDDRATLTPRQVVELWRARALELDLSAEADLYAEDATWEAPFMDPDTQVRGRENIRSMLLASKKGLEHNHVRPEGYRSVTWHETTDPEVVIVEFEVYGQMGRNKTFALPYIQVFRVRNGEILSLRDYYTSGTATASRRF
jgi:uncharacterized protein